MKKNIVLLIAICLLMSCAEKEKGLGRANHEIYFDYNDCVEDFDIGTLTDTVMQIVPLETTDEALIANIDKIEIKNDRIYIRDELAKSVYVYDMNGTYLNRINKVGQGPGEYTFVSYMAVTDSTVIIIDHYLGKQIEYQIPSMKFLREEWIFEKLWCRDLFYMSDGMIYYINDWSNSKSGKYLLFSRKGNSDNIDKYLPFEEDPFCLGLGNAYRYAIADNQASIIYSGNDTVYRLDAAGKVYPEYLVKIKNDRIVYGSKIENVFRDNPPGRVFGIKSINESDKYIFLDIDVSVENGKPLQKGHRDSYTCMYDKQNRTSVVYPYSAVNSKFDNQWVGVRRIIGNKLIDWREADMVLYETEYVLKNRTFKNKTFEKQLRQVRSNLTADDNPVLYIYTLK